MRGRGGFSLAELTAVVSILGILAALGGPRMMEQLAWIRVRGAANQLTAGLAYARQLAVRNGDRARLVVIPAPDCPAGPGQVAGHRFHVVATGGVASAVELRGGGSRVCLSTNQSDAIVFSSRGLPVGFGNRTYVVWQEGRRAADTVTVSSVGRVLRRY